MDRAGDITQWYSTYLVYVRPWVPTPAPKNKIKTYWIDNLNWQRECEKNDFHFQTIIQATSLTKGWGRDKIHRERER